MEADPNVGALLVALGLTVLFIVAVQVYIHRTEWPRPLGWIESGVVSAVFLGIAGLLFGAVFPAAWPLAVFAYIWLFLFWWPMLKLGQNRFVEMFLATQRMAEEARGRRLGVPPPGAEVAVTGDDPTTRTRSTGTRDPDAPAERLERGSRLARATAMVLGAGTVVTVGVGVVLTAATIRRAAGDGAPSVSDGLVYGYMLCAIAWLVLAALASWAFYRMPARPPGAQTRPRMAVIGWLPYIHLYYYGRIAWDLAAANRGGLWYALAIAGLVCWFAFIPAATPAGVFAPNTEVTEVLWLVAAAGVSAQVAVAIFALLMFRATRVAGAPRAAAEWLE